MNLSVREKERNRPMSSYPPNLKSVLVKTKRKQSEIPAFIGLRQGKNHWGVPWIISPVEGGVGSDNVDKNICMYF